MNYLHGNHYHENTEAPKHPRDILPAYEVWRFSMIIKIKFVMPSMVVVVIPSNQTTGQVPEDFQPRTFKLCLFFSVSGKKMKSR